jgi:hypothetical protein
MTIFYVLIYIVSLTLQLPVSLNIRNQCQGINLTSPVYFIHGGGWYAVPDQKINVNAVMGSYLEFDSGQDILEGTLAYRIQKKYVGSAQDESKHVWLLVAWHIEHKNGLNVRTLLVEHGKKLDKDKLRKLHQRYWHLLDAQIDPIGSNWFLDDATVLTTSVKLMSEGYRWDIFITEGIKHNVERPFWIDAKRCVVIMLTIFLMLMRTISLTLYKTMIMTIHNQYPDIKLASQAYFCSRAKRYEYLVNRTDTGTIMKIGFRFELDQDEFGGILMYKMQRKGNTKSGHQSSTDIKVIEEALKMMQLLVTWKVKHLEEPKVNIVLAKHDSDLVLNEDKLAQLYDKINDMPSKEYSWFLEYDDIFESTWLVCDNTVMETRYGVNYEEGLELKINISEGVRNLNIIKPMWIDPKM